MSNALNAFSEQGDGIGELALSAACIDLVFRYLQEQCTPSREIPRCLKSAWELGRGVFIWDCVCWMLLPWSVWAGGLYLASQRCRPVPIRDRGLWLCWPTVVIPGERFLKLSLGCVPAGGTAKAVWVQLGSAGDGPDGNTGICGMHCWSSHTLPTCMQV